MTLKTYLKKLEKRKIISRKPHPIFPFINAILIFILYTISIPQSKTFSALFLALAIFALIFAILHLIAYKILTSK